MRKLIQKIKRPTLDGVLAGFKKTVADLRRIQDDNQKKIDTRRSKIAMHQDSIDAHYTAISDHKAESESAGKIAGKIEELISA